MTQNALNQKFLLANAGIPLLDMKFVNAFANISTIGQNDLYTVPAGKRAIIAGLIANGQASATATMYFKNSGTYYLAATSVSLTAGTPQNLVTLLPLILEAGEVLSVNLAGGSGTVNVWPQIIEYSNLSALKSVKTLAMASGNTLCYTCPAGKTAIITDQELNFGGISATMFSNTSSSVTSYFQYVPSGQSPGTTFRITNNVTCSALAASSASRGPSLGAGDMIYANCNNTFAMCGIFNIVEF